MFSNNFDFQRKNIFIFNQNILVFKIFFSSNLILLGEKSFKDEFFNWFCMSFQDAIAFALKEYFPYVAVPEIYAYAVSPSKFEIFLVFPDVKNISLFNQKKCAQ